jgi:alkylation response protein AidB-like acyl-CoA dehydrogenase
LTEEQVLLRTRFGSWRRADRAARRGDRSTRRVPEDIRQLLASHDVLALPFPAEHGGFGADL